MTSTVIEAMRAGAETTLTVIDGVGAPVETTSATVETRPARVGGISTVMGVTSAGVEMTSIRVETSVAGVEMNGTGVPTRSAQGKPRGDRAGTDGLRGKVVLALSGRAALGCHGFWIGGETICIRGERVSPSTPMNRPLKSQGRKKSTVTSTPNLVEKTPWPHIQAGVGVAWVHGTKRRAANLSVFQYM